MISVAHLTKRYGRFAAVDDVSFEVERGEVVGFLGPNGAGKTTTMRILSGYLSATAGEVKVAGYDVLTQSLEVRRRIGYLPESVPLYPEMRVDEYLRFRARIKQLPSRRLRSMLGEVKERCGLQQMGREVIGHLSRGYRQRVGLADVLVHDPELLILDEPTLGLDPNQNRQIRELIKQLASRHTILLCTHILPEAELTCKRLLIINKGRIVASDTPENLKSTLGGGNRIRIEVKGPLDEVRKAMTVLPHVHRADLCEDGSWIHGLIETAREVDLRPNIFELIVRRGWVLRDLSLENRSLEDVYIGLTQAPIAREGD